MVQILTGNEHDIGGLKVRRVLPNAGRRSVGPFVFFDHIGPHRFEPGVGIDVRPHPHIGLATVTFLWEGVLRHRDSLGSVQDIRPGDVNWMTAGRGIVHSERTPDAERASGHTMHGLQTWVALPKAHEEAEPAFTHHPAASLPVIERPGLRMVVVAGDAFGERAPVEVFSRTLYVSIELQAGAELQLPDEHAERALYPVQGEVELDCGDRSHRLDLNHMAVLDAGTTPVLRANAPARVMLLGGDPLDGPRAMWWNFVASSRDRIEAAKARWEDGGFGEVPGEREFIPLPDR